MAEKKPADPRKIQKIANDNAVTDEPEYYIVYDRKEDLDSWLARNKPSKLPSKAIVTCWAVESESYEIDKSKMDFKNLHKRWKKLKKSGHPINYFSIRDLAKKKGTMHGSWAFVVGTELVDQTWRMIATQFVTDAFSDSAIMVQVCSKIENECGSQHVFTLKTRDFTDEQQIYKLHDALRSSGVTAGMFYAPDVYDDLDIEKDNDFNIKIYTYYSRYDVLKMKSNVKTTLT